MCIFCFHGIIVHDERSFHFKEQSWNNHNLHSVPLDLDVSLTRLDLSNNFIRQLHTLGLPYLEQLDLSSNRLDLISKEAFESLTRLEELNLSRNMLNNNLQSNSKALQYLSRLKSLDLSMNGLSHDTAKLYLQSKPSLNQLKMTGNALTRLTHNLFKDNKGLSAVTIDDNLISVIDPGTFEPLSRLETLNLAKNNLANICDFNLRQVKHLNLSMNSVEFFLTHEDDHMYSLEILDLSYNKLLHFPIVPKRNHLKYLYLQYNMLGTLTSEVTMVTETNALYNEIVNKGDVRVGKNQLHSNWRQMPLSYIDLSYNHFKLFPLETLSLISSLEILNFSHNCVQNIMWNVRNSSESGYHRPLFFPSLKYLNLESNGLVSVSPLFLNMLTQIETLNLQDNSVQPCAPMDYFEDSTRRMNHNASCVVFGKLRSLKHLSLRENNIKILHRNSFHKTSLVSLNLARNPQMVMQVGALEGVQRTLQSLTISELSMTNSGLSLPCMPELTHLDMSNNKLNIIPSSLACSPLREMSIRNNTFLSLNHSLIRALSAHLDVMYISENYFNCCDSRWLMILNEQRIRVPDISQTQCFDGVHNIHIKEYLRNSSLYCVFTEAQNIHFVQIIILNLFVSVLIAVSIMSIRKMCCAHTQINNVYWFKM